MRIIEATSVNWNGVRERLGLNVAEMDMPAELESLYHSNSAHDELSDFAGWDAAAEIPKERQQEAAVFASLEQSHAAFSHVPVGYWRHPVSLPTEVIGKILVGFGFSKPQDLRRISPVGRILSVA